MKVGNNVTIKAWKLIVIVLFGGATGGLICNLYYMYQIAKMVMEGC